MKNQLYAHRVEHFAKLVQSGVKPFAAMQKARVASAIKTSCISMYITDGRLSERGKKISSKQMAYELMTEANKLREAYKKRITDTPTVAACSSSNAANNKVEQAMRELRENHPSGKWIQIKGGLRSVAARHKISYGTLLKYGALRTDGRGRAGMFLIEPVESIADAPVVTAIEESNDSTLTVERCVDFLKSLGYKVLKPVQEYVEL